MRVKLIVAGVAIAIICLTVDYKCVDKLVIDSLRAHWSTSGEAPWGTAERDENGSVPVVLWLPVPGRYCYDAVFSKELRERLAALHATTVDVDYNVLSDFGWPRRYTVRAVSGIPVDDHSRQDAGLMLDLEPPDDGSRGVETDCTRWLANR